MWNFFKKLTDVKAKPTQSREATEEEKEQIKAKIAMVRSLVESAFGGKPDDEAFNAMEVPGQKSVNTKLKYDHHVGEQIVIKNDKATSKLAHNFKPGEVCEIVAYHDYHTKSSGKQTYWAKSTEEDGYKLDQMINIDDFQSY